MTSEASRLRLDRPGSTRIANEADDLPLRPISAQPESLTTMVYESLRDAIVAKRLRPGVRVSEARLAEQLAVSKTPVREALLRLASIGLVQPDGRHRVRVVRPSRDHIQHAYEVRAALELLAARLAAKRALPSQIERIKVAADRSLSCEIPSNEDAFRGWDFRFHSLVATASGNPMLEQLVENSLILTLALRRRDVPIANSDSESHRPHAAISVAISHHDSENAAESMYSHVARITSTALETFRDPVL